MNKCHLFLKWLFLTINLYIFTKCLWTNELQNILLRMLSKGGSSEPPTCKHYNVQDHQSSINGGGGEVVAQLNSK
jgi:hypothetical protein